MHGGTTYDCLAKLPLHHLYSMICYAYTVLDNNTLTKQLA